MECDRKNSRARYEKDRERILARNKRWYEANREKRIAQTVEYGRAHPEVRRAAAQRYRQEHPEKCRERQRAYFAANKERFYAWAKLRRAADPARMIIHNHNARAKRMGLQGLITTEEWTALLQDFNHCCAGCGTHAADIEAIYPGREVLLEVDHIVPVSRGGANLISNIQPLCQSCNNRKRYKTVDNRPDHIREKYTVAA